MNTHKIIGIYLILLFLFLISAVNSFAVPKTALGGDWLDPNDWSPNGVPLPADDVTIPLNTTMTLTLATADLRQTGVSTVINVYGTISFVGVGRIRLDYNDGDVINIFSGGNINSDNAFFGVLDFGGNSVFVTPDNPIDTPTSIEDGASTPLPIELLSFNADLSGEVVQISWATAAEINNDFFTLERSTDGIDWESIGEEAGAGNSIIRLDYNFTDYNPIPGFSYYRLKQTDYDGQYEYFTAVVVLYEPDNLFKVFPNPFTDQVNITTSSDLSNASIFVKNVNGHEEMSETFASSHQAKIDLSNLPVGVYFVEIAYPESVVRKRIVKK
jgi:hypothetical protein